MYNISLHSLIQQNIQISRKRRERWNKDVPDNPEEGEVKSSEVIQSCLTLCDPMDCSLSGSSVHEIFQARVLEWIAIPSPGDLPDPGIEPRSLALQADTLPSEPLLIDI